MARPICIDLFCGLGGWSEGFIAEGFDVIGFDIERHDYGTGGYPGQLVLQDVLTLHGSQFRNAACIVASPPCQEFSYMAMPWKRAKQIAAALRGHGGFPEGYRGSRTVAELTALFDACFRIQREASEAAGRRIPMVVENVRGAQPWVGRALWSFGSYYLWGDVPALMPTTFRAQKVETYSDPRRNGGKGSHLTSQAENLRRLYGEDAPCGCWDKESFHRVNGMAPGDVCANAGRKVPGLNFHEHEKTSKPGRSFQSAAVEGLKQPGISGLRDNGKGSGWFADGAASVGSRSHARKAASAQIAKIPLALAQWIARVYRPEERAA